MRRWRRRWTRRRARALWRARSIPVLRLRRRVAILVGAVAIGTFAALFAQAADAAGALFDRGVRQMPWLPLALTPLGFVAVAAVTRRLAPLARGSGIPQVIVAAESPVASGPLLGTRTAIAKAVLTVGALLVGASVGREGPTVQLAGAVMRRTYRLLRVDLSRPVIIAGGAAGVAAAFNTPLAGLLFAIEELAASYEQRMTLLVLSAIVIAGMVAQGLQGDYVYFGTIAAHMPLAGALVVVPVAGILGGLAGGGFARALLALSLGGHRWVDAARRRPLLLAAGCGMVVAGLGVATGLTWGTGYAASRAILAGDGLPWWFGPAKLLATLATAASGLPGGIFAPSLAVGAGMGNLLQDLFPGQHGDAVVIVGIVAYFAGVVRAPLTAVVILSETTASHELLLPMFAAAFIADGVSQLVCREKLYHGLARPFRTGAPPPTAREED